MKYFRFCSINSVVLVMLSIFAIGCSKEESEPPRKLPAITSVSPATGYIGDKVTLTLENFEDANFYEVLFGGVKAEVVEKTARKIVVIAPEDGESWIDPPTR